MPMASQALENLLSSAGADLGAEVALHRRTGRNTGNSRAGMQDHRPLGEGFELAAHAKGQPPTAPAHAQQDPATNFPNKPIRIIVGYAAGGGNDIVQRVLAPKLSEGLGQPVIVENEADAQSIVAAELVAKSAPDGYTLLMGPTGPIAMNPAIYSRLPHSPLRDFAPISMID